MTHPRERDTLKAVLALLRMRNVLHFRMNSGSLRDRTGRPVRFGTPGMADILTFQQMIVPEYRGSSVGMAQVPWKNISVSIPCWIEVKTPNGKQSPCQKSFQALVEAEGHRYVVARSLDDVLRVIE